MQLGPYLLGPNDTPENGIYTGDAKELAKLIPDESVDLIFTDPVYDRIEDYEWLAQTANRILKPDKSVLCFFGIGYIEDTLKALAKGGCPHKWICAIFVPGAGSRIAQKAFCNWQALAWCGNEPISCISDAQVAYTSTLTGSHQWKKNPAPLTKFLQGFTRVGDNVLDFFCGGGVIPAICNIQKRRWLAFEIDPKTAGLARKRVKDTELPLFAEQTSLL